MFNGKKITVVMPAYNAATTLKQTYQETLEQGIVDLVIIVDDASQDATTEIAQSLPGNVIFHRHDKNTGYGGNQKTCYQLALEAGTDVVIMVHPDYQYTPRLIPAMATMITSGIYDCVLASRLLVGGALKGGMPLWRYVPNRFLTWTANLLLGAHLSEYHTGYRAFHRKILEKLPLEANSDNFVFDNQMLAQIVWFDFPIGEISCPTSYHAEASSVGFLGSVRYGLGCLGTALAFRGAHWGVIRSAMFPARTSSGMP